ncbi:ankyrin repeat and SOCS box protein 8-like isoform X2 [Littorina saxatilis]|uniref:ankyrin repeat and SOCS box protein 8-like isoform X2 n=1 Tax=Littorina saxatilis TaxID=31220 RepID=UPI0038B6404D
MDDSDIEATSDVWNLEECGMKHNKEEKEALQQWYAQGNVDLVQLLISHGADIRGKRRNLKFRHWQPLHLACQSKSPTSTVLKIVKLLVEGGASVSDHDGHNALPVMHAVSCNHAEVVEYLLNRGADPNGWFYCKPPLILACAKDDTKIHPSIVSSLLAAGADPNTPNFNQDCIPQACACLSIEKLLLLFAYRSTLDIGVVTLGDITSLMEAVLRKTSSSDAAHKDKYFIILELLFAAGLKFATNNRKWIENEIVTLECGENRALGVELTEKTLILFNSFVFSPKKLLTLCRLRIRSCILPDIDVNLRSLPVPASIRRFLQFGDIAVRATYADGVAVAEL